jgi:hypothetical protein
MEEHTNPVNNHCCPTMERVLERGDSALFYEPVIRRYAIKELHEDTTGVMANTIKFCPWCSTKLPPSLADAWEETLKKEFGIKNPMDAYRKKTVPAEFLTNEWWKKRGL